MKTFLISTSRKLRPIRSMGGCVAVSLLLSGSLIAQPFAELEPLVEGLALPAAIVNAGDGSGRLFIVELRGRIRIVDQDKLLNTPFLDITDRVEQMGEGGLLGLAFHPDYATNGRFFINYTSKVGDQLKTVIAEHQVTDDPNIANPEGRMLLEFEQPSPIHNGGDLAFGPDRMLYIASGDGGADPPVGFRGQQLDSLLGKILRLDVDGEPPYEIPPDNPLVDQPGARGEIWAWGLRNPFRFSFDPLTSRLFVGDVGDARIEEVDIIIPGGNYGWNLVEGSECYPPMNECDKTGLIPPIHEYRHDVGRSVIGGHVYRGSQAPFLWGSYIFGDFVSGRLWALQEHSNGNWKRQDLGNANFLLSTFGLDESGELYVADLAGGRVFKIGWGWRQVIAPFGDGPSAEGSFVTILIVTNPNPLEVSGVIEFYDTDGQPRSVRVGEFEGTRLEVSLPARTSRSFISAGVSEPFFNGWAEVKSTERLSAGVVYSLGNRVTGAAASTLDTGFLIHVAGNSVNGTDSGIALANPSGRDTCTVDIDAVDSNGEPIAEETRSLEPGHSSTFFVTELGQFPSQFEATVRIKSSCTVGATAILTLGGIHATSLPVAVDN